MEKSAIFEMMPNAETDYEIATDRCLKDMKQMTLQMAAKQQQIEQLQAETQALLAELRVG